MRFSAIFLSFIHQIDLKLHIFILLNDLYSWAVISPVLDHSKIINLLFVCCLFVVCLFVVCLLFVCCLFVVCLLSVCCLFLVFLLFVCCLFAVCLWFVCCLLFVCLLVFCCSFVVCLLFFCLLTLSLWPLGHVTVLYDSRGYSLSSRLVGW